jgi:hypothetical protein
MLREWRPAEEIGVSDVARELLLRAGGTHQRLQNFILVGDHELGTRGNF